MMQSAQKYSDILNAVYTKDQALEFHNQVDTLISSIFTTGVSFEKKVEQVFAYELKEIIVGTLKNHNINTQDPIQLKNFVLDIKQELDSVPTVTLYLAFEPTLETLKHISEWFIKSLNKKYLLDIQIKREIIGGAIIITKGIMRDYSLSNRLQDMYKKGDFFTILSSLEKV